MAWDGDAAARPRATMRAVFALLVLALVYTIASLVSVNNFMVISLKNMSWNQTDFWGQMESNEKKGNTVNDAATKEDSKMIAHKRAVPPFPAYGTPEFVKKCPWAVASTDERNCTILVRPDPADREGVSLWVSLIAQAHQLAQQFNCHLVFDYGAGINVTSVIIPSLLNWIPPEGFICRRNDRHCHHWESPSRAPRVSVKDIEQRENKTVGDLPLYRYAYNLKRPHLRLHNDGFQSIQQNIPSFQPDIGMACSMEALFRLSPDSAQYVPNLLTEIMPTLHADDTLVISLYIRTLQADKSVDKEQKGENNPFVEEKDYRSMSMDIINCALKQEQEYLRNSTLTKTVWSVFSDSANLKQWIAKTYTNSTRQVLITDSRGAHTRSDHGPSQVDFAEAMIDWYLIGECDIVVMDRNSVSYGGTAALRTARPVYDASKGKCEKAIPIHDQ